jgi:DnaJ-class molecular chaperone
VLEVGDIPQYNDWAESYSGHDSTKEYNVQLSFEEAAKGTEYAVDLYKRVECPKCWGELSELGFTWQVCVYCEGTGSYRTSVLLL